MSSKVLFAPMAYSRFDPEESLPARFDRLLDESPLKGIVAGKTVAIKFHVGRYLSFSTIAPIFVRKLVTKVKEWGGRCFLTDHDVEDRRPGERGYTEDIVGCPVVDVCGLLGKYYYPVDVDYKTFRHVDIAGHIHDADVMIDFSHVKGHGVCGFGGACKNIAMGCVTGRTRGELHGLEGGVDWDESKCTHCEQCITSCNHHANSFSDEGKYEMFYHNCTSCQHCVKVCPTGAITLTEGAYASFQEGMAIATKTVLDSFAPGNVYYINVLTNITALCDCWGFTSPSLVPDIGIMASSDIVAVERASIDAIKIENLIPQGVPSSYTMSGRGHLFEQLHGKSPFVQLDALERLGLGTQEYEIKEIL
jgi:uncharacterized Fe-S center protein